MAEVFAGNPQLFWLFPLFFDSKFKFKFFKIKIKIIKSR